MHVYILTKVCDRKLVTETQKWGHTGVHIKITTSTPIGLVNSEKVNIVQLEVENKSECIHLFFKYSFSLPIYLHDILQIRLKNAYVHGDFTCGGPLIIPQ